MAHFDQLTHTPQARAPQTTATPGSREPSLGRKTAPAETPGIICPDAPDESAGIACPFCEYDLTGLQSHRCPECGRWFDPRTVAIDADRLFRRRAWWAGTITAGLCLVLVFPLALVDHGLAFWDNALWAAMAAPLLTVAAIPLLFPLTFFWFGGAEIIRGGLQRRCMWRVRLGTMVVCFPTMFVGWLASGMV